MSLLTACNHPQLRFLRVTRYGLAIAVRLRSTSRQGPVRVRPIYGGMSKTMKVKSLVLVACVALAGTAFAADGAASCKAKCAMCHGADGSASTGMGKSMGLKPLSSPEVQKMSDADMAALINNGKGKMPAFKGKLSDDEISAVVKYVRTLK